ncbi:unnamed protein product, partial [Ostreobium quekettii]
VDTFVVEAPNIQEIQKLAIHHDNSGRSPAWHLDAVEVTKGAPPGAKTILFLCRSWLGGGAPARVVLEPSARGRGDRDDYAVSVATSDVKGAGTDADVSLNLCGSEGSTGFQRLWAEHDTFERGKVDEFDLKRLSRVGDMMSLTIRSDGSGTGAAWHVSHVSVRRASDGAIAYFAFNRWMGKSHGLEATAEASSMHPDRLMQEYRLMVHTSDQ